MGRETRGRAKPAAPITISDSIFKQPKRIHVRYLAARCVRVMYGLSLDNRGHRECRVPAAPAASCAKLVVHTSVVATGSPEQPGIPRAMVLTAYFVLPGDRLSCHRRCADHPAKLDASVGASGPHDFAVRVSAIRQARCPRPPHPAPNVRDDRDTSLFRDGMAEF